MIITKDVQVKVFEQLQSVEREVILDIEGFQDLHNQLAIIQLGKRDLAIAKVIQPFFENHMDTIVANYYIPDSKGTFPTENY